MTKHSPTVGRDPQLKRTRFSEYDGKKVVVLFTLGDRQVPLIGTACLEDHAELGSALRVRPDDPQLGTPDVILYEKSWRGRVVADLTYGGEFCFILPS